MNGKLAMTALLLVVAFISSITTLAVERVVAPSTAQAQVPTQGGPFDGYILYAQARRAEAKDEAFIFVNPQTGDIWVYRDQVVKEHYRLTKLGEPLEKVND